MSIVQDTARALMDEATGDLNTAKQIAHERLAQDAVFRATLAEPLMLAAIEAALEKEWASYRSKHWSAPTEYVPAMREGPRLLQKGEGVYRQIYDTRKALELGRLDADEKGLKMHAHLRASRYVQKRFLLHLWRAWRGLPAE